MPIIRVGVQAVTGSDGQGVDFDAGDHATTLSLTNQGAESVQYTTGSTWTTVAAGASATVGTVGIDDFRLRKVTSGAYPVPVDVSVEAQVVSELTAAQSLAVQALVSDDGIAYLLGDGVEAASGAITIASTATAGNLTGTFYYNVTFVTPMGETAPWPGTPNSTGAITSKQVSLSAIPVSPDSSVTARNLWRSDGTTTEPKDFQFLATISDNTTTVYVDNVAANSGITPDWNATNRGRIMDGAVEVARFSDQTTSLGYGAFGNGTPGYASTAIGYNALYDNTSGRRNVAVGVYALESVTAGYENTAVGTHAGGGLVGAGAADNTMIGYAAGGTSADAGAFNTFIGASVGAAAQKKGSNNTAVGALALNAFTGGEWSNMIAVGFKAGQYANASNQLFIDPRERTNIAGNQDAGIIYGETSATVSAQRLRLNAFVRLGPPTATGAVAATVASLPAAASALTGYRGYVTDSNASTFAAIVAGGGSTVVPVYCDGTNWRIG